MKTIDEIYNELKTAFETETGIALNDGGDMALRFRVFAAQLASLQAQADYVERQCFPQTAVGEALNTHALQRGLSRKPAEKAVGTIRFYLNAPAESDISVAAGTRCITADELEFEVTESGVISPGSTFCDVPAQAVKAGKNGNIPENTLVFMELAPVGVSGCTNTAPFDGGRDEETDESLRARVIDSFYNAENSGNTAYYRNLALSVEGVAAVSVQPRHRGRGTVDITVAGENGIPAPRVLSQVSQRMNIRREICVDVNVSEPIIHQVDVDIELTVKEGADYAAAAARAEAAIRDYFTGKRLGKGVKKAEIGSLIFGIEGVENYTINSPEHDLAATPPVLPVLNELTISEAVQ
ncbi:MAG: baseplate J/gp47 family protein [Bacillota bacterium]|nr:baseplate J/gp47 family protein [Bacillota bacterium]